MVRIKNGYILNIGKTGKSNDGPVYRWLNRPISISLSRFLVNFNITPNQISFFSFVLSVIAAGLFALGNYWFLALGGIIAQFASIIDGSDGEVARLKYLSSDYGGWFDAVLDRYEKIRAVISKSSVPEDPIHAENVLEWLLKLKPDADEALQIAALAHDIDRADERTKIQRSDFNDYDQFKAAHANNSAKILKDILAQCQVEQSVVDEACRLVERHEIGGEPRSDLLKDADSISYFEVNMPLYYQREGYDETLNRCIWGYQRLSPKMKEICQKITYSHYSLDKILKEAIYKASEGRGAGSCNNTK